MVFSGADFLSATDITQVALLSSCLGTTAPPAGNTVPLSGMAAAAAAAVLPLRGLEEGSYVSLKRKL